MTEPVIITQPEYGKGAAVFPATADVTCVAAPVDEDSLAQAVREQQCRAVIVGPAPYRGPLYEAMAEVAAGRGGILARFGVGHDGIDKALARQHCLIVTNTPGVLDVSVAEHAMALMLALARGVGRADAAMHAGRYEPLPGIELRGRSLLLVGFGAIARRTAVAAAHGFGMKVTAVGRRSPDQISRDEGRSLQAVLNEYGAERYTTDLDAALPESDVVSLHVPVTPQTTGTMNAARLARMRPRALLVNTARGAVVDEAALYDALASGRLAGAAIDVFTREPYEPVVPGKDLRTLANVVLTPHVGSNTAEANARMARAALDNVRRFLAGERDGLSRVDT